jgi:outer membrane protein
MKRWIALGALAFAVPLHAADLVTVYRAALDNDSVYAEARAKYEAAQEKVPISRAGLLPNVALSGDSFWNRQDLTNNSGENRYDFNSNSYLLSLTQPLFRWQNWVGYDQGKLFAAQAEAGFANARQDLILRVSQAYFDVLVAQENLRAAQSYRSAVASQLDTAQKAFDIGTGIKTDVFDAQARFQLASSQVTLTETELEVKQRALESIIGSLPPSLAPKRKGATLSPPQPAEQGKWVEAATQGNLLVAQQQFGLEIAAREVERQRAGHLPTLDLVASSGRVKGLNSGQPELNETDRVGVRLNVPIFQGGEISARTSEAMANRRAAESALETAKRGATLSARQAYIGVVNGLVQIRTLEAAVAASQESVESNKAAFAVGVRLGIDVLNAEAQVYSSRRELTRTVLETLLAQLKLKAATGALGEDDVLAVNALLDPEGR